MTDNRPYKHCLIFALILIVCLGLALVIPWLASSQSQAAQSEVDAQGGFMNPHVHERGFSSSPAEDAKLATDSEHAPEATRYYVAKTGDGTNPTGGWSTASKSLQNALLLAVLGGGGEVWVAAGVYYPDEGGLQTDNSRTSTFYLWNNTLYGGFDTDDTKLSDRDWETNVTVLSGDIDGDDNTDRDGVVTDTDNINGNNAYHVVTATRGNITGILDGFTITAGQANSLYPNNSGGGFFCDGSTSSNACSPFLNNVVFSGNLANRKGGAMYNEGFDNGTSSPILTNVTFSSNWAYYGGAMYNDGRSNGSSSPSLTNVMFSSNTAFFSGGAMFNDGETNGSSSPSLTNVTFSGNSTDGSGGAMYNNGNSNGSSSPSLMDVTFSGNSAAHAGGAMYNIGFINGNSTPSLTNVAFSGNSASSVGGAMYNNCSGNTGTISPILTNVTFSGNSAEDGGAIYNYGSDGGTTSLQVRNSILWNNQDSSGTGTINANIYNDENAATTILMRSLAQGTGDSSSWTLDPSFVNGGGNIDADPLFILNIDPSTAPTTTGNLRLKTGSPAIDAGDNTFAAGVLTDLDGEARIVDGDGDGTATVDMGAYETQIYYIYLPLIFR